MLPDAIVFEHVNKIYDRRHMSKMMGVLGKLKTGALNGQIVYSCRNVITDLSFKVSRGECVGIIGPNGAGKSTILKLINGVVDISSGCVQVNGSVGGIFEVGAGFQYELTAEENVKLNLTFQGQSLREANAAVDQVFELAELSEYRKTMFGHLSSGQGMRLGFVSALIANTDIVLLDEVLAVGDAAFRAKSLEMCKSYLKGKTTVFVSHDMGDIASICDRVIVIDQGKLDFDGPPKEAIDRYSELLKLSVTQTFTAPPSNRHYVSLKPKAAVKSMTLATKGETGSSFRKGAVISCSTEIEGDISTVELEIQLKKIQFGRLLSTISSSKLRFRNSGRCLWEFETAAFPAGEYLLTVNVAPGYLEAPIAESVNFLIVSTDPLNTTGFLDPSFRNVNENAGKIF